MDIQDLKEGIEQLRDPRRQWGNLRHKLVDIVFIALCTIICSGEAYEDMEEFARERQAWLSQFVELPNGIPDSDTFRRVFERLNSNELLHCLQNSLAGACEQGGRLINIDGKTVRGSQKGEASAVHIVSAWVHEAGITLGQVGVKGKGKEIPAMNELIDLLDIKGDIVTIDAMGCQESIVKKIRSHEADYVLAVKGNQATLHQQIHEYFCWLEKEQPRTESYERWSSPVENDHGRIERREIDVATSVDWLEGKERWQDVTSIIRYRSFREAGGQTSVTDRYYISSFETSAEQFGHLIRQHWLIENGLHWMLDVVFREDSQKARKDHSPMNMNSLRKFALSLLMNAPADKRTSIRRKMLKAAWNSQFLQLVLFGF